MSRSYVNHKNATSHKFRNQKIDNSRKKQNIIITLANMLAMSTIKCFSLVKSFVNVMKHLLRCALYEHIYFTMNIVAVCMLRIFDQNIVC